MQLWLVALAAVLMWRGDVGAAVPVRRRLWEYSPGAFVLAGWGLLIGSVAVTIAAGGTVG